MGKDYVERRDGNYYIGRSRVTWETVLVLWQAGQTPEQIQDDFPTISLASVYGAIAYYLDNREEGDRYLEEGRANWRRLAEQQERERPDFIARMRQRFAEARERLGMEPEPGEPQGEPWRDGAESAEPKTLEPRTP
jgi:uncharacterized protein (DUF433 family)